jgi:hypothetical protein
MSLKCGIESRRREAMLEVEVSARQRWPGLSRKYEYGIAGSNGRVTWPACVSVDCPRSAAGKAGIGNTASRAVHAT